MALFHGLGERTLGIGVTRIPVKQEGLALPDPTNTAPENWMASCVVTGHLVAVIRGQVEFWTTDHSACLQEVRTALWKRSAHRAEENLAGTIAGALVQDAC